MARPIRERDIEKRVKRWARDHGWYVRKFSSPSQRSVPDDLFMKQGQVIFIEMKRPGETPTDSQWEEIEKIRLAGGHADWCDDVDICKAILRGDVSVPEVGDRSHPRTRLRGRAVSPDDSSGGERVRRVDGRAGGEKARKRRRTVRNPEDSWFTE